MESVYANVLRVFRDADRSSILCNDFECVVRIVKVALLVFAGIYEYEYEYEYESYTFTTY